MSAFRMLGIKHKVKESKIEKSILDYLKENNIFGWKAKTTGTFDPKRKKFRRNPHMLKGVSDILGIYQGRPLAIEVKRPSPKTYPTKDQKIFLERFKAEGGIAFVARSVEDVEKGLGEYK